MTIFKDSTPSGSAYSNGLPVVTATLDMSFCSSTIFSDKRVFELSFVPDRILHRNEQILTIRSNWSDLERGVTPENLLCVGDFGTGKTAVVRSLCRDLPNGTVSVYVNCSEQNTQLRVLRAALAELDVPVKTGFPGDYYVRLFKDAVARRTAVVLVLDEVDRLVERRNSEYTELFYTLSRTVQNVTCVLLTNRVNLEATLLSSLDSRVRDTFRWKKVEFGDYNASELGAILSDRCRIGLRESAYDVGTIASIARKAYTGGLRARGVINLARRAAEIAEANRHDMIIEDDIKAAAAEPRTSEVVRLLPPVHRGILAYIRHNSPTNTEGTAWFRAEGPARGWGQSPATWSSRVSELQTMTLVTAEKHGRGRGKGVEMRYSVPPELVSVVDESLAVLEEGHPTPYDMKCKCPHTPENQTNERKNPLQ